MRANLANLNISPYLTIPLPDKESINAQVKELNSRTNFKLPDRLDPFCSYNNLVKPGKNNPSGLRTTAALAIMDLHKPVYSLVNQLVSKEGIQRYSNAEADIKLIPSRHNMKNAKDVAKAIAEYIHTQDKDKKINLFIEAIGPSEFGFKVEKAMVQSYFSSPIVSLTPPLDFTSSVLKNLRSLLSPQERKRVSFQFMDRANGNLILQQMTNFAVNIPKLLKNKIDIVVESRDELEKLKLKYNMNSGFKAMARFLDEQNLHKSTPYYDVPIRDAQMTLQLVDAQQKSTQDSCTIGVFGGLHSNIINVLQDDFKVNYEFIGEISSGYSQERHLFFNQNDLPEKRLMKYLFDDYCTKEYDSIRDDMYELIDNMSEADIKEFGKIIDECYFDVNEHYTIESVVPYELEKMAKELKSLIEDFEPDEN